MKTYLKEHVLLIMGIAIPLVMMILFTIVSIVPRYVVAPPAYDLLFLSKGYNNHYKVQFKVIEGKLKVSFEYTPPSPNSVPYYQDPTTPKLYRFRAATQSVEEIGYNVPTEIPNMPASTPIEIKELENVELETSTLSPDGYQYQGEQYRNNDLGGLFFGSRCCGVAYISKNGRSVGLKPMNDTNQYYYGNTQFLGWIKQR